MRRRVLVSASLVLAVVLGTSTAAQQPVRRMRGAIPPPAFVGDSGAAAMPLLSGMPSVDVLLAGKAVRFLIDTGAQGHGRLRREMAESLGLAPTGTVQAGDGSGRTQTRNLYTLPSIRVAGIELKEVQFSEMVDPGNRFPEAAGILGLGLFANHLLTLDYAGGRLRMERASLPEGAMTYPQGGSVGLRLTIGTEEIDAVLDTGNTVGALILPAAILKKIPLKGEPRVVGKASTAMSTMEISQVELAVPVKLGKVTLPVTEATFPALGDAGNLGSRALTSAVVKIDQINRRVEITVGNAAGEARRPD